MCKSLYIRFNARIFDCKSNNKGKQKMKLSKHMQDELNDKGAVKLCLEALGLVGFIAISYGALLLINAYATQGV